MTVKATSIKRSFIAAIALSVCAVPTFATDVTISGATNASAIQATLSGGGGTGTITFSSTATLTMDQGLVNVTGIIVNNTVTGTIDFQASTNRIVFADAAGAMTLTGNAQLTVAGTNTAAGFDFAATASSKTLTLTSSTAGTFNTAVNANNLVIGGSNTLVFATSGNTDTINHINVTGAATLQFNQNATITTLTHGAAATIDLNTDDVDLTITNSTNIGANKLTLLGSGGGTNETLNGTFVLDNAAGEIEVTASNVLDAINGMTITVSADGATLDTNESFSPTAVNMTTTSGDLTLQVATGKTLTTTIDVNANTLTIAETGTISTVQLDTTAATVQANASATITTLTHTAAGTINLGDTVNLTVTNGINVGAFTMSLAGSGAGAQDTFTATVNLNNASSELEITGADVDNITGTTVVVGANGATLDTNINTAPTAVNMTAGVGDLTLQVATGKTMTTTIDVNDNSLTVAETGTVSTVQLDTAAGTILANAAGTITNLTHTAAGVITLGNTINFTVTNAFNLGANKLTLNGSGGGAQDTFTATVNLNNASSELEIAGVDADNVTGFTVTVAADGATLDTNINTAPAAVNMTTTSGDLTLQVAAGKTMTTTIDVNANTLTLAETGTVSTVQLDTAAATILASAAATITTLTHTAAGVITLGDTIDLTVTNAFNLGANKLTLNGSGAGGQDQFSATVQLDNAASELEIAGADVDNITAFTVTVSADGATLDTNINTAPTAVNMDTTSGDLTLQVATGKTMTTTVDVNANTLTLAETGTVSTIQLDTTAATIQANANATATTITHTAAGAINLGDGVNFTVTNAFNLGAFKLSLAGSGGTAQDTFTATVNLDNASSELEITGADVDNVTGTTVVVAADGATLDANINTSPTAVNMTTTSGDLTLQVATGKTMTTTIDVNANSLTLAETGTVSTVLLDTAAATILANAAATVTTLTHTAAGVITLGNTINFTVSNTINLGANKLTLNGSGGGAQDTFTATVNMNNAASELEIGGADADNLTGFSVTVAADGATLDANITTTPTAVNMTAGSGDLTLEIAATTMTTTIDVNDNTLTITEAGSGTVSTVQLDTAGGVVDLNTAKTITNLNATNTSGSVTLNNGATLSGTVNLNGAGGTFVAAETGTITTLVIGAVGAIFDVNESHTVTTLTQNQNGTIDIAATKTLTATANMGTAKTLTLLGTGTLTTALVNTASDRLDIDADVSITTLTVSAAGIFDVASGVTWTQSVDAAGNNLTLAGAGTIQALDVQTQNATRTVTLETGANITITTLTPDFTGAGAGAGILLFAGNGSATITNAFADLPENGDTIQKTGTGSLTIKPGITTSFANGTGVKLDIDAGTVVIGSAGSNDDITFSDDADEITVAGPGTLTTFGSFTVSAAGANVNLDAADGSIINLNSASGAETITGLANDDYHFGDITIGGSNGDYTISDAFDYVSGNINVNSTGSFINNQPSGQIKFYPGSAVIVSGSGTVSFNGQASGTPIILDTTTGAGVWTFNQGSSTNVTLQNATVTRGTYTDTGGKAAECQLTLTGVTYGADIINWTGTCSTTGGGGGGSGGGGDSTTTTDPDGTDGEVVDDGSAGDDMATGGDDAPTDGNDPTDEDVATGDDPPSRIPVIEESDDTGRADIANDSVEVVVDGLDEGKEVKLETDGDGMTRLTVGDEGNPDLTITVSGVDDGSAMDLNFEEDGSQTLTVNNTDGTQAISMNVSGSGTGSEIAVAIDDSGDQTVTVTDSDGGDYIVDLNDLPTAADVNFQIDNQGGASVEVTDPSGDAPNTFLAASNVGSSVTFDVTYDAAPDVQAARILPGFPGFENEETLGGSVTLDATGLTTESIITVALTYFEADLNNIREADVRIQRLNVASGEYEITGDFDAGSSAPTGSLGDYGVDTTNNFAWVETNTLGKFAAGVPRVAQADGGAAMPTCGGGGLCGSMGMLCLPLAFFSLMGLKTTTRRRRK